MNRSSNSLISFNDYLQLGKLMPKLQPDFLRLFFCFISCPPNQSGHQIHGFITSSGAVKSATKITPSAVTLTLVPLLPMDTPETQHRTCEFSPLSSSVVLLHKPRYHLSPYALEYGNRRILSKIPSPITGNHPIPCASLTVPYISVSEA